MCTVHAFLFRISEYGLLGFGKCTWEFSNSNLWILLLVKQMPNMGFSSGGEESTYCTEGCVGITITEKAGWNTGIGRAGVGSGRLRSFEKRWHVICGFHLTWCNFITCGRSQECRRTRLRGSRWWNTRVAIIVMMMVSLFFYRLMLLGRMIRWYLVLLMMTLLFRTGTGSSSASGWNRCGRGMSTRDTLADSENQLLISEIFRGKCWRGCNSRWATKTWRWASSVKCKPS